MTTAPCKHVRPLHWLNCIRCGAPPEAAAQPAPATVTVLGEHRRTFLGICSCGWRSKLDKSIDRSEREHVAAVLDAHYAERERAAVERFCDDLLTDLSQEWDRDTQLGLQTYSEAYLSEMSPVSLAERERAAAEKALRDAADALVWVRPAKSPCGESIPECCGEERYCDAMRPSVSVVGEQWLRDRADTYRTDKETTDG